MRCSNCRILLALVVVDLGSSSSGAERRPNPGAGLGLGHLPVDALFQAAMTVQDVSESVGQHIQQLLEPLERCGARTFSCVRELMSIPSRNRMADHVGRPETALSARTQVDSSRRDAWLRIDSRVPPQRRGAETNEGLREALLAETRSVQAPPDRRRFRGGWIGSIGRRFGSGIDGVRDIVEAAAGNQPEIHAEEAAERLRGMLERNQRELSWHVARANGLLAKWAAQAAAEERRLEARLSKMREGQMAAVSEVVTTAEGHLRRAALDKQIQGVREEWFERQAVLREQLTRRQQDIAERMRAVTIDSKIMAKLYDEFLMGKKAKIDTSVANEDSFRRALELILEDTEEGGWERVVSTRNGALSVERKFIGKNSGGSKFACIRAWCSMDVPAEAIAEMMESSERVKEYNKWFLEGRDLELLDENTKVVWASSPSPLPFVKPRDFVTVVHVRRLEDGSIIVVNRGYKHPEAPPSTEYVRGEVILAANVIRPDPKDRNRTQFTLLTQVDPGGIAPAWIVNKISAHDPVDFLERVETAAGRSESAKRSRKPKSPPPAVSSSSDVSAQSPAKHSPAGAKERIDNGGKLSERRR
ncbi:conserved unknown protein [Ectocarpus siliculosus]|uniref:START domain-containing protein n=1 Tax=Ectocarpus siliculosus TaxID=2880 RepID=D7G2E9_ECTSI|nr:conserved unknown protein [Ectocarpus siliculosus]|eukprot:CBJ33383.1 conserved unknown protein [Ectocarpus siliculosus]